MSVLHSLLCVVCVFLVSVSVPCVRGGPGPVLVNGVDPMPVWILIAFNKLSKVDGVEQLFSADFYLSVFWVDSRYSRNVTTEDSFDPSTMFTPALEFVNGQSPTQTVDSPYYFTTTPRWISDDDLSAFGYTRDDLWTEADFRYIGDFVTVLDMVEFPYDSQTMRLNIESALYTADNLHIYYYSNFTAGERTILPQKFAVVGWDVTGTDLYSFRNYYPSYGNYFHRFVVEIVLSRQPDFYVNKIVVGVVLLTLISITMFVLAANEADRMMGTIATYAGLITYLFVIIGLVPAVPYSTRLDTLTTFSFFVVFVLYLLHAMIYFCTHVDTIDHEGGEVDPEPSVLSAGRSRRNKSKEETASIDWDVPPIDSARRKANQIQPINEAKQHGEANSETESLKVPSGEVNVEMGIPSSNGQTPNSPSVFRRTSMAMVRGVNAHVIGRALKVKRYLKKLSLSRQMDVILAFSFSIMYLVGAAVIMKAPIPNKPNVAGL